MTPIKSPVSLLVWLHRILDIFTPLTTLFLITYLNGVPWNDKYIVMGLIGGLSFVLFSQATGVYSHWRGRTLFQGYKKVLQGWMITWVFLIVLAFTLKDSESFSRATIISWALLTPVALFLYRLIILLMLAKARAKGWNRKNIVIVGFGVLGQRLAETLLQAKMLGYNPVAFYDDKIMDKKLSAFNIPYKETVIPYKGTIDELLAEDPAKLGIDEVYITLPLRAEKKIKKILNVLSDSTVTVKFIPDFFSFDLLHSRITDIGGIPVVSVFDTPLSSVGNVIIKRLEDIIISTLILLLISPILLAIAIAIKVTSEGPVIFKQRRYGLNGEEIMVWKFRSMTVCENNDEIIQAKKNDSRITPLGSFLRRTSLDELPQFFNALTGRMSIVGPRPHASAHNEQYRKLIPNYMQRHLVKPGITGWAQIHGWRGETDTLEKMEKRIEFDLHYIDNWSPWLDIKIILLTVIKGFFNKNAY